MNEQNVVDIEPKATQRRFTDRSRTEQPLKKAELNDIVGHEALVLVTAIAQSVMLGLEWKEKRRVRRILLMIASGALILVGLMELVIGLLKS
jgi:hypothetical protein